MMLFSVYLIGFLYESLCLNFVKHCSTILKHCFTIPKDMLWKWKIHGFWAKMRQKWGKKPSFLRFVCVRIFINHWLLAFYKIRQKRALFESQSSLVENIAAIWACFVIYYWQILIKQKEGMNHAIHSLWPYYEGYDYWSFAFAQLLRL